MIFTKRLTTIGLLSAALIISGCNTTKAPTTVDGYDAKIFSKATGAAARSSIAKICGATGVGQYRSAFITKMKQDHSINQSTERKLRALFRDSDNRTRKNFKDKERIKKHCKDNRGHQMRINRGIQGNFSGQF